GSGHILGAVVGAALVALMQNKLQDALPYFSSNGGQLEIVVFSVLFILVLQFARGGIMPMLRRILPKVAAPPESALAEPLPRRTMPVRGIPILSVERL